MRCVPYVCVCLRCVARAGAHLGRAPERGRGSAQANFTRFSGAPSPSQTSFTSRAEHRLLLRCDNADARLTALGYEAGLVGAERHRVFERKKAAVERGLGAVPAVVGAHADAAGRPGPTQPRE